MNAYNVRLDDACVLSIGFGCPAQNDQIVRDAKAGIDELIKSGRIAGGEIIRINGPASLPVAMALGHALSHLYQAVACYDPKLAKYVVAIAHSDKFQVGDLID